MSESPQSISEFHRALLDGKTTVSAMTETYLQAAKASRHNAYLTLCEDRAREQAKVLDREFKKDSTKALERFPLLGVPMAVKDILTIEGVRTTAGSRILENYVPPYTATAVERMESAGGITLGKANLDEFAMGSSNENSAFGAVEHPTHANRVPGGSSGGSATAVGANLAMAALGTDTGGSVRQPASFCDLVGFKPTYGRISRYGLIAFASSLDQVGTFTRTIEDAARLYDALAGHDPRDSTSLNEPAPSARQALGASFSWKNLKIGIPQSLLESPGIQKEVRERFEEFLKECKAQGAVVKPIELRNLPSAVAVYYVVAVSEASSNLSRMDGVRFGTRAPGASQKPLQDFYEDVRALFGSEVKRRILLGTFALSSGYHEAYYQKACQVRRLILNDYLEAFRSVDLLVSPVSPVTAFKRGEKIDDPLQMYLTDLFTIPPSLAGLPALSLPAGVDSRGLPIGIQLIAPHRDEAKLLRTAHAYEQRSRRS